MSNAKIMNLFIIAAAFIITYAYFNYINYNSSKHSIINKLSLKSIFIFSLVLVILMFYKSIQPKDWDYTCFYLIGKVASSGLNIYNPEHYSAILQNANIPLELSTDFKNEFMVTGCLYPPPTVLFILPLGYMTYMQGLYFSYAIIFLSFIGCIYLIKNTFFENSDWQGWFIACILLSLTAPFYSILKYTQTLVLLLFLLILVYKNKERKISGFYLAISIFIKPFSIILFLYFLIKKRWDIALSFILTVIGLLLATTILLGFQPFYDYIFHNPSFRVPNIAFFEETNQSLFAVLCRAFGNMQTAKIVYYIVSFLLIIFSGIIILFHLKNRKPYNILFPLLLSVSLIIYPNTLYHYAVVHILSLLIIISLIKNYRLVYLFLFLFYIVLIAKIFYLNIFILTVSYMLIFEEQVKRLFYKRLLIKRLFLAE